MTCPNPKCRHENAAHAQHCAQCGAALPAPASAARPAAGPAAGRNPPAPAGSGGFPRRLVFGIVVTLVLTLLLLAIKAGFVAGFVAVLLVIALLVIALLLLGGLG